MPIVAIRPHVSAAFLIGGSVSTDADLPSVAEADYVTIGPVFGSANSSLGVEEFVRFMRACGKPSIAIGGIFASSAHQLRSAGASGVAVIRAIFAVDDCQAAAAALKDSFTKAVPVPSQKS